MALHQNLPIYKVAYDLFNLVTDLVRNMPRDFKQSIGTEINRKLLGRCEGLDDLEFDVVWTDASEGAHG